jgi:hypothetical protein
LQKEPVGLYDGQMMELPEEANENRLVWKSGDPDGAYVREYLAQMMAHFQDCKIHFDIVIREMLDSLIRCAPGDPYAKLPDEYDIHGGLSCLLPAAEMLKLRVDAYWKALDRLHADRITRLATELSCDKGDGLSRLGRSAQRGLNGQTRRHHADACGDYPFSKGRLGHTSREICRNGCYRFRHAPRQPTEPAQRGLSIFTSTETSTPKITYPESASQQATVRAAVDAG